MAKRKRTILRAHDRAQEKYSQALEKRFQLEPGASATRAIKVTSPAEVEVLARAIPCPICQGELRVEEHTAETLETHRLRIAHVVCAVCRSRRRIYFQLAATMLN
jgi:hypothetical protein